MASKLNTIRGPIGESAHHRHELKVEILLPHMKCGNEEVVNAGDGGCLQKQLGLRAALLAGDQHFGDCRRFGKGHLAVHLAHEVAAQRNQEENTEAAARQADKDGLHRVRIEMEDVKRGNGEDRAGHHAAGSAAPMPVMITFSSRLERRLYTRARPMARIEMGIAASIPWPTFSAE